MSKAKSEKTLELELQLKRALADYDNLQKRVQKERLELGSLIKTQFVTKLLPGIDNLERAQKHLADPALQVAIEEFKNILKEEGIVEIQAEKGTMFDENTHEAIDKIETNELEDDNKIAEKVSSGWKTQNDIIIRHAKVIVFKKN